MSKDRLSIHQDSGGQLIQEAFTIMRDGGTTAQSGLVGITNSGYPEGGQPIIPETLFNTQSSRQSHIRFSSAPSGIFNRNVESAIQILGNGNTRSSGIQLTYLPECDNASVIGDGGGGGGGNDPVYKKYTLEKCSPDTGFVYVYDPQSINPQIGDVVSYQLTDGSTGCATVNTFVFTSNQDSSQITQNFLANGCSVCQGDPQEELWVYLVSPCDGGDDFYIKNIGFDVTGDPVVKYTIDGVLKCGTLDTSSNVAGDSAILVEGLVPGGCSDPICVPPDPPSRFYNVIECGYAIPYVIEVTNSLVMTSSQAFKLFDDPRCWEVVSETTSQTADFVGDVEKVYDACFECEAENDITFYQVRLCPGLGGTSDPFEVGTALPYGVTQSHVLVYFEANWQEILGLPCPNYYCCDFLGTDVRSDFPVTTAYITEEHTDCDCGSAATFSKVTLERCSGGIFDEVTISASTPSPQLESVWSYTTNGSDSYCGTVQSTIQNQPEILNSDLLSEYIDCPTCEGSDPSDYVIRLETTAIAPNDLVFDSNGDCISGPCAGTDCGDICSNAIYYISATQSCAQSLAINDYVEFLLYDDPTPSNRYYGKVKQLYAPNTAPDAATGEVTDCNNPTVPGELLYCFNCDPDVGGNFSSLPDYLEDSVGETRYGSNSEGGNTGSSQAVPTANGQDLVVADFSLIRPSGTTGFEFGHLSFSERGYVGVGLTKADKTRLFTPNSPLTVNYAGYQHRDSGTISMRAQSEAPNNNGNYGKVYVKPFTDLGGSQALFFKDDVGVETNLLIASDIDCCETINDYKGPSGMVYGDTNFNTYAGWYTPKSRSLTTGIENNTFYGQAVGFDLVSQNASENNTLIGFSAGSGAILSSGMTVVGSNSFVNYASAKNSVIIGHNNVKSAMFVPAEDVSSPMSGVIIGTNLYVNSDPPTGILAIGHGSTPLVTGQLTGSDKTFSVNDASLILSTGVNHDLTISVNQPYFNVNNVFTSIDKNSTGTTVRDAFQFDVSNGDGYTVTLLEMYSLANERSNTPSYADQGFMWTEMSTDFRLKGAIRFQDGTSLSGVPDWIAFEDFATSGVGITTYGDYRWFTLDFTELQLAQGVSNDVRTDNTFVAVQLDGTNSTNVGKMSLQGLADYISDSFTSISENCNVILTDPENAVDLNATANSESVFIGCDVGTRASGWKNSVIIGTEAGWESTTSNPTLSTSTAAVFLGYRAGYDSDNIDNTIFIGTAAGRDADAAADSIFVGASAGLGSSYSDSIGIGQNSLRGAGVGEGNIEIVANLLDSQRLFHSAGNVDNRLNIQNIIAGDTSARFLSIGDARLSPEAPLEARRDSTIHSTTNNNYIQSWHHDDAVVGAVESDGSLSGFVVEGVLTQTLAAPADATLNTTANLEIYYNGSTTNQITTITNRDPGFNAGIGAYILAIRIGGEYRPMNATCCGAGGIP